MGFRNKLDELLNVHFYCRTTGPTLQEPLRPRSLRRRLPRPCLPSQAAAPAHGRSRGYPWAMTSPGPISPCTAGSSGLFLIFSLSFFLPFLPPSLPSPPPLPPSLFFSLSLSLLLFVLISILFRFKFYFLNKRL